MLLPPPSPTGFHLVDFYLGCRFFHGGLRFGFPLGARLGASVVFSFSVLFKPRVPMIRTGRYPEENKFKIAEQFKQTVVITAERLFHQELAFLEKGRWYHEVESDSPLSSGSGMKSP